MRKFKVIALSVGGRGNKIHESGDVVHEGHFHPGRASELVDQGFLKEIGETDEDDEDQNMGSDINENGTSVELSAIGKTTVVQLKGDLTRRGIFFEPTEKKESLYKKWVDSADKD